MRLFACLLAVTLCGTTNAADAQQIASAPQGGAAVSSKPLATLLTIDVVNVPMRMALDEIVRLSGVRIDYSRTVVPMERRVSVRGTGITLGVALKQALVGTGTEAREVEEGGVVITRAGVAKVAAKIQGVIIGKVTDSKSGRGISGANVSIDNDTRGVTSDENGTYRVSGIAVGTHIVTVRLVGYSKQTHQVMVGEGATVTVDFKLEPSASVLDQVVVTGTIVSTELKAVPNAITVITAKQIEERGITRIDQLFRGEIPGLFALNQGSNALLDEVVMFSRGATALTSGALGSAGVSNSVTALTNPIKTYVDGVELSNSQYLSQIDPTSIERIEILAGPQASTIYGANAINGVMQIFTKRGMGNKPQLVFNSFTGVAQNNFSNSLAPNHLADLNLSGLEGRVSYSMGSSWNYTGSWTPAKRTQRLSVNGSGRLDIGKFTADISARQGLTKNRQAGSQLQSTNELTADGLYSLTFFTGAYTVKDNSLSGKTLGLSLGFRAFPWWSHDVGVGSDVSTVESIKFAPSFTATFDTTLSVEPSATSRLSARYTNTMQLPVSSFAKFNLVIGGDRWRTKGFTTSAFPWLFLTGNLVLPSASRIKPGRNSGAFMQGQLGFSDALFLTYGVRTDWNPNFGDKAKVRPGRYGVSYTRDIGPVSAKLRGSYGRSIRPPNDGQAPPAPETDFLTYVAVFGPHYAQLENSNLGPEHQQGGEGGLELYLGSRGSLVITRYNQTVDNLISRIGNGGPGTRTPGPDSVRSLTPQSAGVFACSSTFRDADGYCYKYQSQFLNIGSIRNQGWELQSSINLGSLTTRGTYSWAKSRILGITPRYKALLTGSQYEAGRPFDYLPEHSWALGFTYAKFASSVSLYINGVGSRYVSRDATAAYMSSQLRLQLNRIRMATPSNYRSIGAGYATSDLNATHRFSSHIDGTLQISNLSNYYQNDYDVAYSSIGRQTKLGLRWRVN